MVMGDEMLSVHRAASDVKGLVEILLESAEMRKCLLGKIVAVGLGGWVAHGVLLNTRHGYEAMKSGVKRPRRILEMTGDNERTKTRSCGCVRCLLVPFLCRWVRIGDLAVSQQIDPWLQVELRAMHFHRFKLFRSIGVLCHRKAR